MAMSSYPLPPCRLMRVYTYDPSINARLDTAVINETTLQVPWESNLEPGPVGEYLEVVDFDPASQCFYEPVDLNDHHILAQNGLSPSESSPQFHQQMVYAVAMATIWSFEQALGRKALWAHRGWDGKSRTYCREPIVRLRIYPHALREPNAYYSPAKVALLFGYFPAGLNAPDEPSENLPGGLVFTCLSHDVVAHETAHALLHGLHRHYSEDTNADALAFHEAFADIVALFQHFSQPEALRHQIAKTRGNLRGNHLLAELAHQFGQAIGNHGALRNAIGKVKDGAWLPHEPSPSDYPSAAEPHERGSVLVAALFDAFLAIYESRTEDLIRIATGGTGNLPDGRIPPDLVNRLAREASKAASHLLWMAIRALDYCPPVDLTFGDYLRALITGDADLMPVDPMGYRIAVIEGFRRRGIYPTDVRTLADDSLRWRNPLKEIEKHDFSGLLEAFARLHDRPERVTNDRSQIASSSEELRHAAWQWFKVSLGKEVRANPSSSPIGWRSERSAISALGLALDEHAPRSIYRSETDGLPSLQIHSVRYALRPRKNGGTIRDVVVEVVQRRRGYLNPDIQREVDSLTDDLPLDSEKVNPKYRPDFTFRGGCSLVIDGESGFVRYVIARDILSDERVSSRRTYESRKAVIEAEVCHPTLTEAPSREKVHDAYFKADEVQSACFATHRAMPDELGPDEEDPNAALRRDEEYRQRSRPFDESYRVETASAKLERSYQLSYFDPQHDWRRIDGE
ncbi:MAG: hypothetical protein JWN86_2324 [Planctomycetota bacterium]|nr:hypothetical protein [Planctomycetota bacterium]